MRALVAILLCVLASQGDAKHAPAKPATTCKLNFPDELKAARRIAARAGWGVYPLEGADVAKFLAAFNSAEPKTDFKAESVIVAVNPEFAYVEMFSGGCISNESKLAPKAFDALMGEAFGGEIPGATAI